MSIYAQFKTCSKCKESKSIDCFNTHNKTIDGYRKWCKDCDKKQRQEYYLKNIEKLTQKKKQYYLDNRDNELLRRKEYHQSKKDDIEYQNKRKEWSKNNPDKVRESNNKYRNNRKKNDPVYMIQLKMYGIVRKCIRRKGYTKRSKTNDIVGCDWIILKEHIENQFTQEMNWDNYGTYWDIDHIIPISSAKTEEEVLKLNHYTNLQPLESFYNRHIKRGNLLMSNYRDYNGSPIDYDRDTSILDTSNRDYNRKWGITNPNINMDDYTGDYEPDLFDSDCW